MADASRYHGIPATLPATATRRKFLKQTTFGTISLSVAALFPLSPDDESVPDSIRQQLVYLSPAEYRLLNTIGSRLVGQSAGSPRQQGTIDIALRADAYLAGADPEVQDQFHQLLWVFDAALFAFVFDFRFSKFSNMTTADQDGYLEDWMTSRFGFRRTAFQALKRTCLSMMYSQPDAWNEIGYKGMFLPEDRQ